MGLIYSLCPSGVDYDWVICFWFGSVLFFFLSSSHIKYCFVLLFQREPGPRSLHTLGRFSTTAVDPSPLLCLTIWGLGIGPAW